MPHLEIPEDLIAQYPLTEPEEGRLLCCFHEKTYHKKVKNLHEILKGVLILVNDSAVWSCRLLGTRERGGQGELLFLGLPKKSTKNQGVYTTALAKPLRQFRVGESFTAWGVKAEILGKDEKSVELLWPFSSEELFLGWLKEKGQIPLPPYIRRPQIEKDKTDYQTCYAQNIGSCAVPAAGLRWTPQLMKRLQEQGCDFVPLTLHVGLGTFQPLRGPAEEHIMHEESYFIPQKTMEAMVQAKKAFRPILYVGTTALRAWESFVREKNWETKTDQWLSTKLFLRPQKDLYKTWGQAALMTNFHQKDSTLFLLMEALMGETPLYNSYFLAMKEKYRFLSYGDGMIWFPPSSLWTDCDMIL